MKQIFVIGFCLIPIGLGGCGGQIQRAQANFSGHTDVCVDHVMYEQFPTGTTAKVTLDKDHNMKGTPC